MARDYKGIGNQETNAAIVTIGNINPSGRGMNGVVYGADGVSPTLTTVHDACAKVAIPVLTPDRVNKRQNGRRMKEDGDPSFTLTSQDRHGVAIGVIDPQGRNGKEVEPKDTVPTLRAQTHGNLPEVVLDVSKSGVNISGHEVRELTDESHCLNANDQNKIFGANQERTMACVTATNIGVLRNVRSEYGKEIRKDYESGNLDISRHEFLEHEVREDGVTNTLSTVTKDNLLAVKCGSDEAEEHPGIYVQLSEDCTVYAIWYEKYQCYIAIRKLTPKECFRLQGWSDDYFEKAEFVNSNSQLYRQAGNGVSVPVIVAIAQKLGNNNEITLQKNNG